jgi:hypothetical protein
MKTVFFAWQSDLPNRTNRTFLEDCLRLAIANVNTSRAPHDRLVLDKDTQGVAGLPVIAEAIFEKISGCSVFVPDLSFVTPGAAERHMPNPNVLIELGYALSEIGDKRVVALFNSAFGDTEDLPFDLRNRRFPLSYCVSDTDSAEERKFQQEKLVKRLALALSDAAKLAPAQEGDGQTDLLPHSAAPLGAFVFVATGPVGRTSALDEGGRPSEFVFWHQSPSALLRVIPNEYRSHTRSQLLQIVSDAPIPLGLLGTAKATHIVPNEYGVAVLGFDREQPDAIATRLSQVFLSGEIWGLNKLLLEPECTQPRTFRILWPDTPIAFEQSLLNYLRFAKESLKLELPVTVVAGLTMTKDAILTRAKPKWLAEAPREVRCFEEKVMHYWEVDDWNIDPGNLLRPLYEAVWDACALKYADEPAAHKWPR